MPTKRSLQLAEVIHQFIATFLAMGRLSDPSLSKGITIQYVKMSADMQLARVYFTVLGDPAKEKDVLRGFKRATGFLRKELAARLDIRYTPRLFFHIDESIERAHRLTQAIDSALKENAADSPLKEPSVDS